MNLQYISDSTGQTTGVFIPIKKWDELKEKYHDIEIEDNTELLHQFIEVDKMNKEDKITIKNLIDVFITKGKLRKLAL